MTNILVPKVSLTETTTSLAVPQDNQVVIGIIGTSEKGTANEVQEIGSITEAHSIFGANTAYGADLVPMIDAAFKEGASVIKAVSIGAPTLDIATANLEGALTADSLAGSIIITVADATIYTAGDIVYLGPDTTYSKSEKLEVLTGVGTTVTLTSAIANTHYVGENLKIVTEKVDGDYTNAIEILKTDVDKNIVICESNSDVTSAAMKTMAISSTFDYNTPCVYIQSALEVDTESTIIAKAQAHNSDRVVVAYPLLVNYDNTVVTPGVNAAASAGLIAGQGLPKLNLNGSEFNTYAGVSGVISNNDALILGGVSGIEVKYGTLHFVKVITTMTSLDSIPNYTWREASIRFNVDVIEKTVLRELQKSYMQKGNTQLTRDSIGQKIISLLTIFENNDIIVKDVITGTPAYKTPVVSVDSVDNTKVNIAIEISPGVPLNFIQLNFNIFI